MACNDYIILDSCIYRILQRHFSQSAYYTQLMDLFHEVGLQVTLPVYLSVITLSMSGRTQLLTVERCDIKLRRQYMVIKAVHGQLMRDQLH